MNYIIRFTNSEKGTITIPKSALITDEVDIALVGKKRREYGLVFNENLLHILENFACPENPANKGNPDLTNSYGLLLENPIEGQLWFNKTNRSLYAWDNSRWVKLRNAGDIAANSGSIAHGQLLPLPVGSDGTTFTYEECSMFVSTFNHPEEVDFSECFVEDDGMVTSRYRIKGDNTLTNGIANYFIVGIKSDDKDSDSSSENPPTSPPAPSPEVTVTPSPTPAVTPSPSAGATPTPTPTVTPSPTPSAIAPIQATLFIAPSDGDLGTPYTTTGNDELLNCDSSSTLVGDCEQVLYVSVKNITGGNGGPYTVEWNLNFETSVNQWHEYQDDPEEGFYNNVTTAPTIDDGTDFNVLQNSGVAVATCQIRAVNWGETFEGADATSEGLWFIKIKSGSYARILDGNGNQLVLYTPSGMNGNVGGTSNTGPTGDYTDAWSSL